MADMAELTKDMPLDLPKYLRKLGVIHSVWRRSVRSLFVVSVSLPSSESSLWLPGTLGVGKDGCKGEVSLEELAFLWGDDGSPGDSG